MIFKTPFFLLLIPLALLVIVAFKRREKLPGLRYSSLTLVDSLKGTWRMRLAAILPYLRMGTLALFIIALAGPRSILEETHTTGEGIDIILALDASGSMAAEDFTINNKRLNRLDVVKNVVADFISARKNDRIGLVAFSAKAYTVSPLTTDTAWLKSNLERVRLGMMEDGTAVGSAIASALSRLRKSQAKSKVVILLTDGINNAGKVAPLAAAQAAKALGIKIYTIGVGTRGLAPFPVQDIWGRTTYQQVRIDIDEATLMKIAEETDGRYFRATDTASLQEIYREIDALEKTLIEQFHYREYKELFIYVLGAALILLLIEIILSQTIFMRIP